MNHHTFGFTEAIASAQDAAAIKLGLEAVPGVRSVHFRSDCTVDVLVEDASTQTTDLLHALACAGFDPTAVELRNDGAILPL